MFSGSDWRDINHCSRPYFSTSLYPRPSFTSTRVYLRLILVLFQNDINKGIALISVISKGEQSRLALDQPISRAISA